MGFPGAHGLCPWVLGHQAHPCSTSSRVEAAELSYNAAPAVMVEQLAAIPLGQQNLLKRLLEPQVPQIDALVAVAANEEVWARQPLPQQPFHPEVEEEMATLTRDVRSLRLDTAEADTLRAPSPIQATVGREDEGSPTASSLSGPPGDNPSSGPGPGNLSSPIVKTERASFFSEPVADPAAAMPDRGGIAERKPSSLSSPVVNGQNTSAASAPPPVPAAIPPPTLTPGAPTVLSRDVDMIQILGHYLSAAKREDRSSEGGKATTGLNMTTTPTSTTSGTLTVRRSFRCFWRHSAPITLAPHSQKVAVSTEEMYHQWQEHAHCVQGAAHARQVGQTTFALPTRFATMPSRRVRSVAVTLHCEQILMDLAKLDSLRMLHCHPCAWQ